MGENHTKAITGIGPSPIQHFNIVITMKNLSFFTLVLVFGTCNTSSEVSDGVSEVEKQLTTGTWFEKEHWLDDDKDGLLTIVQYDDDCNTNDEYRFGVNGNFTFNNGSKHCEPGFPISVSGAWNLARDETVLQWVFDFDNDTLYF